MLIYKDVITGDNLFSDQYRIEVVEDAVYEVSLTSEDGKNLVEEFNLRPLDLGHKGIYLHFQWYQKVLGQLLAEKNPDSVRPFQYGSGRYFEGRLFEIRGCKLYTGSSGNEKGMVVMVRDEDVALFWKYGVQPSES